LLSDTGKLLCPSQHNLLCEALRYFVYHESPCINFVIYVKLCAEIFYPFRLLNSLGETLMSKQFFRHPKETNFLDFLGVDYF